MSTAYKTAYVEKKVNPDFSGLDRNKIRTDNPISHSNKEMLIKHSVAKNDYRPQEMKNNVWVRDTKKQSRLDHVDELLRDVKKPNTTAYRDFLASQHEPDFTRAKVPPPSHRGQPPGEKRSVYNEDYRLKTAGMPTYEIAKKNYEENVKIAREALSGKNVQLKGGAPVKNSSTYKTTFENRSGSLQGEIRPTSNQERINRPSPVNNWMLAKAPMEKSTVYKHSYVNQHVSNCTCDYH